MLFGEHEKVVDYKVFKVPLLNTPRGGKIYIVYDVYTSSVNDDENRFYVGIKLFDGKRVCCKGNNKSYFKVVNKDFNGKNGDILDYSERYLFVISNIDAGHLGKTLIESTANFHSDVLHLLKSFYNYVHDNRQLKFEKPSEEVLSAEEYESPQEALSSSKFGILPVLIDLNPEKVKNYFESVENRFPYVKNKKRYNVIKNSVLGITNRYYFRMHYLNDEELKLLKEFKLDPERLKNVVWDVEYKENIALMLLKIYQKKTGRHFIYFLENYGKGYELNNMMLLYFANIYSAPVSPLFSKYLPNLYRKYLPGLYYRFKQILYRYNVEQLEKFQRNSSKLIAYDEHLQIADNAHLNVVRLVPMDRIRLRIDGKIEIKSRTISSNLAYYSVRDFIRGDQKTLIDDYINIVGGLENVINVRGSRSNENPTL